MAMLTNSNHQHNGMEGTKLILLCDELRRLKKISVSHYNDTWLYSAVQGGMTPTARRCLAVRGATRGVTRHHNKQAALSPLPERNSRVASEPFSAKC